MGHSVAARRCSHGGRSESNRPTARTRVANSQRRTSWKAASAAQTERRPRAWRAMAYSDVRKMSTLAAYALARKPSWRPQRWQDEASRTLASLDVVICYEERIFDAVVEDLQCREAFSAKPVHVVCIDIKDDAENAAMGGQIGLALAQQCEASANLEDDMAGICERFEKEHEKKDIKMMYSVHYL